MAYLQVKIPEKLHDILKEECIRRNTTIKNEVSTMITNQMLRYFSQKIVSCIESNQLDLAKQCAVGNAKLLELRGR